MATVTITRISRKDKVSKAGKPFVSLGIKCEEYGDKWLSGFGRKDNANWKEGDTVEIEVKQVGEYLNFEMPNKEAQAVGAAESRVMNALTLKVIPLLDAIRKDQIAILEKMKMKDPYPEMDETNDAAPLTEDDTPF